MNPDDLRGLVSGHATVPVQRWRNGGTSLARDAVAEECPVALVYNGIPFAVMLASPLDLEDFALGFTWTEGIIDTPADFQGVEVVPETQGFSLYISIPRSRSDSIAGRQRALTGRTGCGLCGARLLEQAVRPVRRLTVPPVHVDPQVLRRAHAELRAGQVLNELTGGVHAAGWARTNGEIVLMREDVGRHNALDKLVGALLQSREDPAAGLVAVTSRASYEMVHKTAAAGVPLLTAVSAPTGLAIRTATEAAVTLVGFTRPDRHTVYSPAPEPL